MSLVNQKVRLNKLEGLIVKEYQSQYSPRVQIKFDRLNAFGFLNSTNFTPGLVILNQSQGRELLNSLKEIDKVIQDRKKNLQISPKAGVRITSGRIEEFGINYTAVEGNENKIRLNGTRPNKEETYIYLKIFNRDVDKPIIFKPSNFGGGRWNNFHYFFDEKYNNYQFKFKNEVTDLDNQQMELFEQEVQ